MFIAIVLLAATAAAGPKECADLPQKLDSCSAYTCQFTHPFTGTPMKRTIIGVKEGKCMYTEEMPNGGRMDCAYTESMRKAIAKQFREIDRAQAGGKSVGFRSTVDTKTGTQKSLTVIDGKESENPLQAALETKQCKISGYDEPQSKKK